MPGGAGGENVERGVFGTHLGCRRRVGGRLALRLRDQLPDRQKIGDLRAAPGDHVDEVGLGEQNLRVEQADAVREDFRALVVVEHSRHRAALHRGQHREHGVRRVPEHDADNVAMPDAVVRQHGRVAVHLLVGLPVSDVFVTEAEEHPPAMPSGAVLEYLADGGFRRRHDQQPGQRGAHDHGGVPHEGGHARNEVEKAYRTGHLAPAFPAQRSSATSMSETNRSRSKAAAATYPVGTSDSSQRRSPS